jgi:xanthine/CO dehydrogenase XdhC/CoxF family maturation factor
MSEQVLLVVGDGPVSEVLASMAELVGWRPEVAVTLGEVEAALPRAGAVVVTSHDSEVDAPAIGLALAAAPAYVGAMGSRTRQAMRREWLLAHGLTDEAVASVHGPAGLDIGADTPGEIALSILAELVATLRGAPSTGSISDRPGPVHPNLPPGEAFSPEG